MGRIISKADQDNQPKTNLVSPTLSNLLKSDNENSLQTEEVFQKVLTLMPIFDFVPQKNKIYQISGVGENLDINLEQGTSILNIEYRDVEKDLIIPVLDKIRLAYQDYSGSKREEFILNKKYLESQIDIQNEKSKFLREAQEFGIEQDLVLEKKIQDKDYFSANLLNANNIFIENVRVREANKTDKLIYKSPK